MNREKILVLADLGGCPPYHFYENIAKNYNIITYIPRPFAITQSHFDIINNFSIAVINDEEHFNFLEDFNKKDDIYWAMEEHNLDENTVSERIAEIGSFFNVSAITTNNELFVVPVATASEKLDLNGAGLIGSKKARDKYLMRKAFNNADLKNVKCEPVNDYKDLEKVIKNIGFPFILKPTYLASSIGVTLFEARDNYKEKFNELVSFINSITVPDSVKPSCKFIAEEYLIGNPKEWYGSDLYGDYVSVEGIMKKGEYYPLSITDKTPQSGFTETSHITPSVLDIEKQKIIFDAAKKANESLDLQYCSTHTEMKLLPNLQIGLIETAARFGGWNIIPNIDKVKEINSPSLLIDALTDKDIGEELITISTMETRKFISDFHLYITDDKSLETDISFNGIVDVTKYVDSSVIINNYNEIEKGTFLKLDNFKAFNGVCEIELISNNSNNIVNSIHSIHNNFELVKGDQN
ncbi:ATP-grasp domain-containing protein [Staphylococcus saprophyticus]|uniref:ATP-grasp domain-containing protein n=1 Tax=Staphylococcus saprophyticus TaxID=29385 RepID=UPI0028967B9F|nr:ATP-grasp domain-containing protein [Staphylococcus saprophyticus]